MPLRDHFHSPIIDQCPWESLHGDWITMIVQRLNEAQLPERYQARGRTHLGTRIEVDVGTYEQPGSVHPPSMGNGVATAVNVWAPPQPMLRVAADFAEVDTFEVQVFVRSGEYRLVAAIELVSPGNKDRPAARATFARKCATYLAQGVSVVVVDVVTDRQANLHEELVSQLKLQHEFQWSSSNGLSAIAYRVGATANETYIEAWPYSVSIGSALPTLPLWLSPDFSVPLELERTYEAACRGLRL